MAGPGLGNWVECQGWGQESIQARNHIVKLGSCGNIGGTPMTADRTSRLENKFTFCHTMLKVLKELEGGGVSRQLAF